MKIISVKFNDGKTVTEMAELMKFVNKGVFGASEVRFDSGLTLEGKLEISATDGTVVVGSNSECKNTWTTV